MIMMMMCIVGGMERNLSLNWTNSGYYIVSTLFQAASININRCLGDGGDRTIGIFEYEFQSNQIKTTTSTKWNHSGVRG